MSVERQFKPRGRRFAWVAGILGTILLADAAWCITTDQLAAAVVVGGVGLERLVFAGTSYWHQRSWPYRLASVRLAPDGLFFDEVDVYTGEHRTTVLPAGLVLEARLQRGTLHEVEAPWVVLLFTILGTLIWSEHDDEQEADAQLTELRAVLAARPDADLRPPTATGRIDIIPAQRGVMWGAAPILPISIALRALLLLSTIVMLPNLVSSTASALLWMLTAVTVALLAFPFVGAVAMLRRPGRLLGYGATAQFGELRAWERSTVTHVVPLRSVRHLGFGDLKLSGAPLNLRLVAHTEPGTQVDAIVPRSAVANLAQQACRLVAEMHDIPDERTNDEQWSVRLPGGVAEAIEAVSWAQRFLAEAQEEPLRD